MANLTLNFADASFDGSDDYYIDPSDGLIYEMGSGGNASDRLQAKSGGDLRATEMGATVTSGAFTLGHNQDFYFEFEEAASAGETDEYEVNVVDVDASGNVVRHNSFEFDISQTDFDGDLMGAHNTSAQLVNGENVTIAVTRVDASGNTIETRDEIFGDGEVANEVSWVISGDTNGSSGGSENAGLAFKAGHYGGVFKGGGGFDTLVFDHGTHGPGTSQMYVGLDAGFAMFGGNVGSPIVQFADVGTGTYTLDWERLEMRGDSDDFVVVGGGLQGQDDTLAARALDTTNFFQIDLGSGADKLYVTDNSQSITLDLSATGNQVVTIDSSGTEFEIDVSGSEMDGTSAGDNATMLVSGTLSGTNPSEGVIDYIDFGGGQNNKVVNTSDQGIAVDFGTVLTDASGADDASETMNSSALRIQTVT